MLPLLYRYSMALHVYISNIGAKFLNSHKLPDFKKLSIADTNYRNEFNVVAAISVDPNSMADIRKGSSYSHSILPLFWTFLATIQGQLKSAEPPFSIKVSI